MDLNEAEARNVETLRAAAEGREPDFTGDMPTPGNAVFVEAEPTPEGFGEEAVVVEDQSQVEEEVVVEPSKSDAF